MTITPAATRSTIGMSFHRHFDPAAVTDFARRLEDGGADEIWLIEDCFYTTAPPLAAAALAVTDRLAIGLGILPAVARTAPITAMEIATLAGIAPGRVIAGIGHGVQSWMAQMGAATSSPLTTLDEVVTAVRQLLAGETVTTRGRHVNLDAVALAAPPSPVPAVVAGVRGPKSLAHAGRHADGVLLDAPCPAAYVRWARQQCAAGETFQLRCFASLWISENRRDSYQAMAPLIGDLLTDGSPTLSHLPFYDELSTRFAAKGEQGIVDMPSDWWQQIGAIGTLDDAFAYIAALEAEGVTGISFFPSIDLETARGQIEQVCRLARR